MRVLYMETTSDLAPLKLYLLPGNYYIFHEGASVLVMDASGVVYVHERCRQHEKMFLVPTIY